MPSILEKNSGLDRITATSVRRDYTEVAKIIKESHKPVEITVNGKTDLIIMNQKLYDGLMDLLEEYSDLLAVLKQRADSAKDEFISTKYFLENIELGEYQNMSIDKLLEL